ncbi:2-hydroxyglutaryl-CoA dehydratase [Desulfosarcina ovata subsp. sediminis]|uniref:2-hydroxyglutaryl-CoA dehydratase n=1 Tax=Desulfosarcina ovata subsp. sediminis TaxID=885957 RepID=A0A5K7ZFS1_9BACT|nr:benzoyl-CoA reductase, bzd-type, subunit Q [Desulfosarcina ovata]BBO81008.1 2-hydroxyglutaryl-CoA dehydratase [Desulfosarcina ovata subsp. sediminis]
MLDRKDNKTEFWRWDEYNWKDDTKDWHDAAVISAGVDVGSVSSQAVILVDGELFATASMRTGHNSPKSAINAINWAMKDTGLTLDDIHFTVGTGYGRAKVPFADKAVTEIACHARGANFMYGSTVRTVLDMGGQDLKVIRCDHRGKVMNFSMNEKCAAGTGRGMEVIADLLRVPIQDIGDLSLQVKNEPPPVSNICVLFAKTEVMGMLYDKVPINEILAAYTRAMADRVSAQIKEMGVEEDFVITGGIGKNKGVVQRIESELGVKALTTKVDYQIAGALGAALFAKVLFEKKKK